MGRFRSSLVFVLLVCLVILHLFVFSSNSLLAANSYPSASGYTGRKGVTIYVSKRGDNSDGSSWEKAFHSIQASLLAVPDEEGGHSIIIRPDTYVEANLYPSHKGAAGSYNLLLGDFDGSLGSGATGQVVIDSGDPEKGFKSFDWWSTMRATQKGWSPKHTDPTFSSIIWDRWIFRNIYATGGDAGLFWDLTNESGSEFTVIVEDCVGIGRAFGGGFGYPVVREKEPIVFRRCYLMCLDWWGDAGGAAIGAYNASMPDYPDAIFEDCTIVGPDNAVQVLNPSRYIRVKFKGCRLIVLNFSQPRGTPSSGIICCDVADNKYPHVDLEDCTLMGYKVFGTGKRKGEISYTTKGKVRAYVQFQQSVPKGFERLGLWPVEIFDTILPPNVSHGKPLAPARPKLVKLPVNFGQAMESTPVIYDSRPLLVQNFRPVGHNPKAEDMYLFIEDIRTGLEVVRFGKRHSFVSAFVNGSELNVFASEYSKDSWTKSIYRFSSTDLKKWERELAIPLEENEHLFNSSVCRDDQGYLMAYESNLPVKFCFKFARSKDLAHWEKIEGLIFAGLNNEYSACPVIRYFAPYYYVIYLHRAIPGHRGYVSFLARSKDLITWELSPMNPILEAGTGEGINNSDVDLFEFDGNTYIFYATGDQESWGTIRIAMYPGLAKQFFQSCFPENAPMIKVTTRR